MKYLLRKIAVGLIYKQQYCPFPKNEQNNSRISFDFL